ncbi:enoyl-CoA hydratase/isomerase family protein [Rhodococcus sp. NPDC056743]|uniref:enoyl-CoA hydratase/isomerase family protein n=1 Tax=Rhodococcus sp. NPDC056743 TaxID=3345934 RepID=UPI00366DC4A2
MSDSFQSSTVEKEISDGVWQVTLSSPGDLNALSSQMRQSILYSLDRVHEQGGRVAIVRGDARAFSSGYRLDPGVMRPSSVVEDRARLVGVTNFMSAYREHPVVTIAEVRGHCLAGGTDLMIASDLSIAADTASIGVPNVRDLGITMLLPLWSWLIGPHRAKLLTLSGDIFSGAEAAEWGLITASLPEDALGARVRSIAERIALMPTEMLQVVKHALNTAWDTAGIHTTLLRAAELDTIAHSTESVGGFWELVVEDGMRAALDRRKSRYAGVRVLDLLTIDNS